MSFIYSSNTPEFLEYIAACKTRDEIYNDPTLCRLLEDPLIKDNMELALLARQADYGTTQDKIEFIGFFLANGPELDTDTIMYYRKKILMSYTYLDIARREFSDMEEVDKLRKEKYKKGLEDDGEDSKNKDSKSDNCFNNPCNYVQEISATLGLLGDAENFKTATNLFARKSKENKDEKDGKKKNTEINDSVWGSIRKHTVSRLIPAFEDGYRLLMKVMNNQVINLTEKNKKKNLEKEVTSVGDSRAEEVSEAASGAVKMNIFAAKGDCARVWEQMRRLRIYEATQNTKKPMVNPGIPSHRTMEGTPTNMVGRRTDDTLGQKPITTSASGACATQEKQTKAEMVLAFLKSVGLQIKEKIEKNKNTSWEQEADSIEWNTLLSGWVECAKRYNWKDEEWKPEFNEYIRDTYGSGANPETLVNPFIDRNSAYWDPDGNPQLYEKLKAEYLALFGGTYPFEKPESNYPDQPDAGTKPATEAEEDEIRKLVDKLDP